MSGYIYMPYSGKYTVKNPKKYNGNHNEVYFRSLWELTYMKWCDGNDDVLRWGSEEVVIPYVSPLDGKGHRYFPDFYVKTKNNDEFIIEVKPKNQCGPPKGLSESQKKNKKSRKRHIRNMITWAINEAKWTAATKFCKKRKWKFMILTEDTLR